jgi:predicted nucleic acid-binding protein
MWIPDINVLLYAHNPEAPRHAEYRHWLEAQVTSGEPFLLPEVVWAGFVRLVTSEVIMKPPASKAPRCTPYRFGPHRRLRGVCEIGPGDGCCRPPRP